MKNEYERFIKKSILFYFTFRTNMISNTMSKKCHIYRTRAIKGRGFYSKKNFLDLCTKVRLTKICPYAYSKNRQKTPVLGLLRGAALIQERPLMARIRYIKICESVCSIFWPNSWPQILNLSTYSKSLGHGGAFKNSCS